MTKEADNGHHELMDSMPGLGGNLREEDTLAGVAASKELSRRLHRTARPGRGG